VNTTAHNEVRASWVPCDVRRYQIRQLQNGRLGVGALSCLSQEAGVTICEHACILGVSLVPQPSQQQHGKEHHQGAGAKQANRLCVYVCPPAMACTPGEFKTGVRLRVLETEHLRGLGKQLHARSADPTAPYFLVDHALLM
jgi:hypothetical protein